MKNNERILRNLELSRLRGENISEIAVAAVEMEPDTVTAIKNYFRSMTSLIADMEPDNKKLFSNELEGLRRVLKK